MENAIEATKPDVAEEARELNVQDDSVSKEASRAPEAGSDSMNVQLSIYDSPASAPDTQTGQAVPSGNIVPVPMGLDPLSQKSPSIEMTNNKKDPSRRVSFPEDGRIVSGYMDPPSPWNDASKCSTDELLGAYRAACEKFGVKPLPNLVQQLHAITDFGDRNETLTFRGERIDSKHCETLEEILRRVQFRTIDLEATHLDEEGAIALFDMIEYYESCIRINISYNRGIGPRGWQSCARMLKKTPCIEHLEAKNCHVTEQVMPMLGRALRMGSMLTTLHMENSTLSGRPLMILVAAIKMNDILRELFLADNKLMPSDGIQLGNMLKVNHNLHLLDVRNNHLQDAGTNHICDGIAEQNLGRGLNTLVLWNNQITYQSMPALSRALTVSRSIETLNLGHNNITNEGIHRLKNGLLINKSLQRIGFQAAKISCEGAVALAEYIADSQKLLRLDLRENDIKTGGLMALSLSLKVSQSVTRIDLDKEPKKETGVRDFADQQRRLLMDITNYMQRNRDLARQREEEDEERRQQEEMEKQLQEIAEAEREEREAREKAEKEQENELQASAMASACPSVLANKPHLHLDLDPSLPARSQTLESPAFVRESELPIQVPPAEPVKKPEGQACPVKRDFPPSPMVSSNGRPVLAPVTEGMTGADLGFPALDSEQNGAALTTITEEQASANAARSTATSTSANVPDTVQKSESDSASSPATSPDDVQLEVGSSGSASQTVSSSADAPPASSVALAADHKVSDSPEQASCDPYVQDATTDIPKTATQVIDGSTVDDAKAAGDNAACHISDQSANSSKTDQQADSEQSASSTAEPSGEQRVKAVPELPEGTSKTGLQTALSANGLKTELASALDGAELKEGPLSEKVPDLPVSEDVLSSPDDFERELDEMLANVQNGLQLQINTNLESDNTSGLES